MHFSLFSTISTLSILCTPALSQITVPVPWQITDLSISNIRHGTGGFWSFNILDSPTTSPQSFNTTCSYENPTTYDFAIDGAPVDQPCNDPSVTFSLYPEGSLFIFNVTHIYGTCGSAPCNDNGTWAFTSDDVRGQEFDAGNNFGQAGGFQEAYIAMYPNRAIASSTCEFCVKKRG